VVYLLKGREIIIYLSIKYRGDWNKIYAAIKAKEMVDEEEVNKEVSSLPCKTVAIIDEEYPESLKKIYKPPFVLFYYGDLSLSSSFHQSLAVIGSRQPSEYGLTMARVLTKDLVEAGLIIVSGLARGIDSVAQQSCVSQNGKTIGVLGSGIDICYPVENKGLFEEIIKNHLLVSEYPPGVGPDKENFPWRNRIIAGLANAVFVVEAKKRSGTLITVGYALYLGKDVFVLPHPVNTDNSCNRLIKDGAILVETVQDILDELKGTHIKTEKEDPSIDIQKKFI
jgi:DNA processing protein